MKSWIKSYTETNHDPKIVTLTWAQRGIWAALLNLAGELDDRDPETEIETGKLDTVEYTAIRIRCSLDELRDALAAFEQRGMIEERDGALYLPHYTARQAVAPSHRPTAQRDRQREHRLRKESHNPVTTLSQAVTTPDSETDTESEENTSTMQAQAPVQLAPEPVKPKATKPARRRKAPSPMFLAICRACHIETESITDKIFWQLDAAATALERAHHTPEQLDELYKDDTGKWYQTFPGLDPRTGTKTPPRWVQVRDGIGQLIATKIGNGNGSNGHGARGSPRAQDNDAWANMDVHAIIESNKLKGARHE